MSSRYLTISVLARTVDDLDVVADNIARYGTIQQRKPGRSERGLRIRVLETRADSLFATLGYLKRKRTVVNVRDITEEVGDGTA